MGQGLGNHSEDVRLHEPHGPPRGSGEVASVHAGEDPPPPSTDHLPDQPQLPPGTALQIDSFCSSCRTALLQGQLIWC